MEGALEKTMDFLQKARDLGLNWPSFEPLLRAIKSEIDEIEETVKKKEPPARLEEEIGDLLIGSIELCRYFGVSPSKALSLAERKFSKRLKKMIEIFGREGTTNLSSLSFENRRLLWQEAKREIAQESGVKLEDS